MVHGGVAATGDEKAGEVSSRCRLRAALLLQMLCFQRYNSGCFRRTRSSVISWSEDLAVGGRGRRGVRDAGGGMSVLRRGAVHGCSDLQVHCALQRLAPWTWTDVSKRVWAIERTIASSLLAQSGDTLDVRSNGWSKS